MSTNLQAEFVKSSPEYRSCPEPKLPEYAFIGRSNVGKSSLINMLTGRKSLAKTSGQPGKTQLINHFLIEKNWYLADLPGYGFAKVSKKMRGEFDKMIRAYCQNRENLINLFVLVDCRHEPQNNDVEFMKWLSENGLPFSIVLTKIDKLNPAKLRSNRSAYEKQLLNHWEELPQIFISSATGKVGREELISFIHHWNQELADHFPSAR